MHAKKILTEMWDLPQLTKMNDRAAAGGAPETFLTRRCSYTGDAEHGIVLHSALRRSTGFVAAGQKAEEFLQRWNAAKTEDERDQTVESYFQESVQVRSTDVVNQLIEA